MAEEGFLNKIEKIKMPIRIVIFAGTIVLLAGLFFYFVYLPKTKAIAEKKESIAGLQQKLAQVKRRARKEQWRSLP